jgi:hypothetical protein
MFNFFKPKAASAQNEAETFVKELLSQAGNNYPYDLKNFPAGAKILAGTPELQRDAAIAILNWLKGQLIVTDSRKVIKLCQALGILLKRSLPFCEADMLNLLDWWPQEHYSYLIGVPTIIKVMSDYLKKNPLTQALRERIDKLITTVERRGKSAEVRRWMLALKDLLGDTSLALPLDTGDAWAETADKEIRTLAREQQIAWTELLIHCLRASGSAPGAKWLKTADKFIAQIGPSVFRDAILRWFPLAEKARPAVSRDNGLSPLPVNADLLKGLAWLSSTKDDPEMARALLALGVSGYRKIPMQGPRSAKVGNACVWALGNMLGMNGIAQLSILKIKVKSLSAQKVIANAFELAARRTGLSADEIEELAVPSYGLEEVGLRRDVFGEFVSTLKVNGSDVSQVWEKAGKALKSAPQAVKTEHAEESKEITQALKDIRKMLPAQRDRIENLFLAQKKWTFSVWRERYINHPLVGTIARRIIWKFSQGDQAASGLWLGGQIVGRDGAPLDWLDDTASVELWHPLYVETDVVLEWRAFLAMHEIQQPFKQAHREIYLLTDAERNTHTYSNRFAAHILRQHQFNALCAVRGWKNSLRLMVDDEFPPATKSLSQWGLRAEYWIEGIGDDYRTDTNETGTFLYLTTDQVRFYRIGAAENRAHASGGGYAARRWNGMGNAEPLPLEEIPALVLSEVLRDVDLFVGVASVGNDPHWMDGGAEVRYRDYWHGYSFGELGESAKTRKQVLEMLIPRLKIAERCSLVDRFLVVRGDLRTYKIHLGSGNILMEPNDQYLCIVPLRSGEGKDEKLFLPFEGDQTLAVILSKAFMLANDKKITDSSITRQIKR